MAVSKRTRFEILRRDNHACRYCGATAPDVKLTVDHVTPVALGGTDDPSNLVAACAPCNSGKASTSPDESLVADVRDDALRHAELTRQAYAILVERIGMSEDYVEEVREVLVETALPVPPDWENSIIRWFEMGVPVEIITDAAKRTSRSTRIAGPAKFKYFCGIVWNQVSTVAAEVPVKAALDGAWMTQEEITEKGIDDYFKGRQAEADHLTPLAAPAFFVEDFIDRHKLGPRPTTAPLVGY